MAEKSRTDMSPFWKDVNKLSTILRIGYSAKVGNVGSTAFAEQLRNAQVIVVPAEPNQLAGEVAGAHVGTVPI